MNLDNCAFASEMLMSINEPTKNKIQTYCTQVSQVGQFIEMSYPDNASLISMSQKKLSF